MVERRKIENLGEDFFFINKNWVGDCLIYKQRNSEFVCFNASQTRGHKFVLSRN